MPAPPFGRSRQTWRHRTTVAPAGQGATHARRRPLAPQGAIGPGNGDNPYRGPLPPAVRGRVVARRAALSSVRRHDAGARSRRTAWIRQEARPARRGSGRRDLGPPVRHVHRGRPTRDRHQRRRRSRILHVSQAIWIPTGIRRLRTRRVGIIPVVCGQPRSPVVRARRGRRPCVCGTAGSKTRCGCRRGAFAGVGQSERVLVVAGRRRVGCRSAAAASVARIAGGLFEAGLARPQGARGHAST